MHRAKKDALVSGNVDDEEILYACGHKCFF